MSQLFLIRHAQASFLEPDYDKLSPRGEDQAAALGRWIVASKLEPHAIFTGPRVRQKHTAAIVADVASRAGRPLPSPTVLSELDEFRAEELILHAMGHLDEHPTLRSLIADPQPGEHADRVRLADRVLRVVLERWSSGALSAPGIETFLGFRERVAAALRTMTSVTGRSRTVLAFSSGGTIGAAAGQLVRADDRGVVDLGLVLHNAAFSEVLFREDEMTLSSHNRKPHLLPSELTYR